jgi:hypothetical protein
MTKSPANYGNAGYYFDQAKTETLILTLLKLLPPPMESIPPTWEKGFLESPEKRMRREAKQNGAQPIENKRSGEIR